MTIQDVDGFVQEGYKACALCAKGLGISDSSLDLTMLLRAARKGEVVRRGDVKVPNGDVYKYHIHGLGYTFTEVESGKKLQFDILSVDGSSHVSFSAWKFHQYLRSVGITLSEDAVLSELNRLSNEESSLIHIQDGPHSYYYYLTET